MVGLLTLKDALFSWLLKLPPNGEQSWVESKSDPHEKIKLRNS